MKKNIFAKKLLIILAVLLFTVTLFGGCEMEHIRSSNVLKDSIFWLLFVIWLYSNFIVFLMKWNSQPKSSLETKRGDSK